MDAPRHTPQGTCHACGYPVDPGICPECGTPCTAEPPDEQDRLGLNLALMMVIMPVLAAFAHCAGYDAAIDAMTQRMAPGDHRIVDAVRRYLGLYIFWYPLSHLFACFLLAWWRSRRHPNIPRHFAGTFFVALLGAILPWFIGCFIVLMCIGGV